MRLFRSYDFYKEEDGYGVFEQNSLGNLGFSETRCLIEPLIQGNQASLKCNIGYIKSLIDVGVTTKFEDQMQCQQNINQACRDIVDVERIRDDFLTMCQNEDKCIF